MIQNLPLATEALGLGSFTHYAAHRFAWTRAFGFQMRVGRSRRSSTRASWGRCSCAPPQEHRHPGGGRTDHDGTAVFKPYAPPYYRTMEEAVRAFVADKFAPGKGIFRDAGPERVAGSGRHPGRDPRVLRGEHPGRHRVLRVRHEALRPVPCELRAVADAHGRSRPTTWTWRSTTGSIARARTPSPRPALRSLASRRRARMTIEPARPDWVPGDLYPFQDRWADIDGNLVHYIDEGSGPSLLLLNGNPSWSFGWRDVVLGLRHRFRCIAPDYPGFGLSRASERTTSGLGRIRPSSRRWSISSGSPR